jgi:hypothetical protein
MTKCDGFMANATSKRPMNQAFATMAEDRQMASQSDGMGGDEENRDKRQETDLAI